jgi:hypothetical protein
MPKQDGRSNAADLAREASARGHNAELFAPAPSWVGRVDQLDYKIRRWVIPMYSEKQTQGVSRSTPNEEPLMGSNGLLSEVQAAIGRHLRAEYDLAQPIPTRLTDLLRQFDQRNSAEVFAL